MTPAAFTLDYREVPDLDAERALPDDYDLVAMFDCLHDMGDPVGAAQHVRKVAERRDAIARAVEEVRTTTRLLKSEGIQCDYVTGAGTGSYMFEAMSSVLNQGQVGMCCYAARWLSWFTI